MASKIAFSGSPLLQELSKYPDISEKSLEDVYIERNGDHELSRGLGWGIDRR
jgi:hypothetical protein